MSTSVNSASKQYYDCPCSEDGVRRPAHVHVTVVHNLPWIGGGGGGQDTPPAKGEGHNNMEQRNRAHAPGIYLPRRSRIVRFRPMELELGGGDSSG